MTRRGMPLEQWLGLFATVAIIGLSAYGGCSGCAPDYSDGDRSGVVWKFSHRGLVRKSWEGELNMGGFRSEATHDKDGNVTGSTLVPNVFRFSAFDQAAVAKLQAAQASGNRVTVRYRQWFVRPVLRQDSAYEVIDVKVSR